MSENENEYALSVIEEFGYILDAFSAFLCLISKGKIDIDLKEILKMFRLPHTIHNIWFCRKMLAVVNGACVSDEDCAKLCAILMEENGDAEDNIIRLLDIIDRIDTKKKVPYMINATRSLLTEFIDLEMYFRICNALTQTLNEDLLYMKNNLEKEDLCYNINVQGLLTTGLMCQHRIDLSSELKYSFTKLAKYVDAFAVSYDDIDKYPNPKKVDLDSEDSVVYIEANGWGDF